MSFMALCKIVDNGLGPWQRVKIKDNPARRYRNLNPGPITEKPNGYAQQDTFGNR